MGNSPNPRDSFDFKSAAINSTSPGTSGHFSRPSKALRRGSSSATLFFTSASSASSENDPSP